MSRHRNIRSLDPEEEYEGYFDVYGHSVPDDDYCISPSTASEFLFDRSKKQSMSAFLTKEVVDEEDEDEEYSGGDESLTRNRTDSLNCHQTKLSEADERKLNKCIDDMLNVVGDTMSECVLKQAALKHNFDSNRALDEVLAAQDSLPKPQRTRRTRERRWNEGKTADLKNTVTSQSIQNEASSQNDPVQVYQDGERLTFGMESPEEVKQKNGAAADKKSSPGEPQKDLLQVSNNKVPDQPDRSPDRGDSASTPRSMRAKNVERNSVAEYEKERGSQKPLINLVVIGHVDAGKSTLMGHLLCSLGCVSKKTLHRYEQDSKKLGKASFMYAWVLDETSEERVRGITMDVAQSKFETPHRCVNLLDAPGHKDFIPNMITGAAQADVAILVVDSTRGEFETGFESGGQTREHTLLARSLGVSQIAVAVNKMDNVEWAEDRYQEIVSKLGSFMKQAGFKESDMSFVPCSGLTGENLVEQSKEAKLASWYKGSPLIDVIDNMKPPERLVSKPFRMCVGDIFKGMSSGFCVAGKIEAGHIQAGDRLLLMPAAEQLTIKNISIDEFQGNQAFAGDQVMLGIAGIDVNKVTLGSVICDVNSPVKVSQCFRARIVLFNIDVPVTKGFPVILHYQNMSEQAVIKKLISHLHRSTGQVIKNKPRCLPKNSSALIELEVNRPICVELYKDNRDLGRFMLRSGGSTIAAGLVTEIL